MGKICPACGSVPLDEYFCRDCGEACFDHSSPSRDKDGASGDSARQAAPLPSPDSSNISSPYPPPGIPPDYSYAPLYHPSVGLKADAPVKRFEIPWNMIIAFLIIIGAIVGLIVLYLHFRAPTIKVSPPPGWIDATQSEREYWEGDIEAINADEKIDFIFSEESGNGLDTILVTHMDAEPDDDLPETRDMGEMEVYLENMDKHDFNADSGFNLYEFRYFIEHAMPVRLGCGAVGLYVEDNPESIGAMEMLVIRTGDRIFLIVFYKAIADETPSQEMQHFIDTIRLN